MNQIKWVRSIKCRHELFIVKDNCLKSVFKFICFYYLLIKIILSNLTIHLEDMFIYIFSTIFITSKVLIANNNMHISSASLLISSKLSSLLLIATVCDTTVVYKHFLQLKRSICDRKCHSEVFNLTANTSS